MNVRVAPSPIHGRGVFANKPIEQDDWQYVYGDLRVILPGDPFERYGIEWDDKTFMPYAPWCCCNHSNEPNCEVTDDDEAVASPILIIIALCDIELNEEITIDYGYDPNTN